VTRGRDKRGSFKRGLFTNISMITLMCNKKSRHSQLKVTKTRQKKLSFVKEKLLTRTKEEENAQKTSSVVSHSLENLWREAFIPHKENKIDHLTTRKDLELQEITKHAPYQPAIHPPLQFDCLVPGKWHRVHQR
jgi:ribosomal protein L17